MNPELAVGECVWLAGIVAGVTGFIQGILARNVRMVFVGALLVLALPGVVGLPLLLSAGGGMNMLGAMIVLGGGLASARWGTEIAKKSGLPLRKCLLKGSVVAGSLIGLTTFVGGVLVLLFCGAFARPGQRGIDPDWGLVWIVGAIQSAIVSFLASLLLGLVGAMLGARRGTGQEAAD